MGQSNSVVLIPPSGPSINYASITSAYGAIPSSLPAGNNYIIELLPTYNGTDLSEVYPILLTSKNLPPGGSTITIRPSVGNTGETIQRPVTIAGHLLEINGGTNIIIDGRPGSISSVFSDYLTIVNNYPGGNSNSIRLFNGAGNNTIQYANITVALHTTTFASTAISITTSPSGLPNNNNIISNNIISGGRIAVGIGGSVEYNTGNTISNNIVKNFSARGILGDVRQDNTTIQNNNIICSAIGNSMDVTGIFVQGGATVTNILNNTISADITGTNIVDALQGVQSLVVSGTVNILNNLITNLSATAATLINGISVGNFGNVNIINNTVKDFYCPVATSMIGIHCSSEGVGANVTISKNKVSSLRSDAAVYNLGITITNRGSCIFDINNNFVSLVDPNTNAKLISGIYLGYAGTGSPPTSSYTSNIYFNSIRIGGTQIGSGNAACIYKKDFIAGQTLYLKNNICIMERTGEQPGDTIAGLVLNNTNGTLDIDYNTYYGSGAVSSYATYWVTTAYDNTQQSLYRSAVYPNEQHSNFRNVSFQSSTDLHLAGASLTDALLNGVPAGGVTVDIDNDTRKTEIPTMGADENALPPPLLNVRSGNWSDPTIWSNNMIPTVTDDVFLKFHVIVDINAICRSLTTRSHTITVNPTINLTIAY